MTPHFKFSNSKKKYHNRRIKYHLKIDPPNDSSEKYTSTLDKLYHFFSFQTYTLAFS